MTLILILRGSPRYFCFRSVARMALGWVWWRAWLRLALLHLCVEAMALSDIDMTFEWLRLVIPALLLCARCGTYGMGWVRSHAWFPLASPRFCRETAAFGGTGLLLRDTTLPAMALMALGWVWWRAWPCLALWHFCVTPVTFGGTDFCGARVVLDDVDVLSCGKRNACWH